MSHDNILTTKKKQCDWLLFLSTIFIMLFKFLKKGKGMLVTVKEFEEKWQFSRCL